MSKSNAWVTVGTLMKNKDNTKDNYIKIKEGITLQPGDFLQVQDPRKKIDQLVASGKLSVEEGAERKAKVPEFVLRDIVKAPSR